MTIEDLGGKWAVAILVVGAVVGLFLPPVFLLAVLVWALGCSVAIFLELAMAIPPRPRNLKPRVTRRAYRLTVAFGLVLTISPFAYWTLRGSSSPWFGMSPLIAGALALPVGYAVTIHVIRRRMKLRLATVRAPVRARTPEEFRADLSGYAPGFGKFIYYPGGYWFADSIPTAAGFLRASGHKCQPGPTEIQLWRRVEPVLEQLTQTTFAQLCGPDSEKWHALGVILRPRAIRFKDEGGCAIDFAPHGLPEKLDLEPWAQFTDQLEIVDAGWGEDNYHP